ncbi:MAG: hypothetical protein ACK4NS_11105, partial [Saprospiraceae bacterium]
MRIITVLVCILISGLPNAYAQKKESLDKAYNLSVGVRKTFKIDKKNSVDLRQQFQFSPRIRKPE